MPVFEVDVNGKSYEIDAPKPPTRDEALAYVSKVTQAQPAPANTAPLVTHAGERPAGGYTEAEGGTPVSESPLSGLLSMAHPQALKDFLGLMLPGELEWTQAARSNMRAGDIAHGVKEGAKSYLSTKAPLVSDIVQAVKEAQTDRIIENPKNIQAAFQAVKAQAAKRGVTLSPDVIAEVMRELAKPTEVTLQPMAQAENAVGVAATGPNRIGSASYGPMGDLKAWVQSKIGAKELEEIAAHPRVKALLDQFGRAIHQ